MDAALACALVPDDSVFVRRLYIIHKFTSAEISLADCLMDGAKLAQAAQRLHVSRNTAKTQLSSMFGETGTDRQSDLARLLSGRRLDRVG